MRLPAAIFRKEDKHMSAIALANAARIAEMTKELLISQFPSFPVVSEEVRQDTIGPCIIDGHNSGGEPYVGAYPGNGYFVIVIDRLCQIQMKNGDKWVATVLISSHENEIGFQSHRETCGTPAELMSAISSHLSEFRPFDTPHVVYMSNDCRRIMAMPEDDWNTDCDRGHHPGNFLARVSGNSHDYVIHEFVKQHPRSDEFLEMCGIMPDRTPRPHF
jgi:hypothetical protein